MLALAFNPPRAFVQLTQSAYIARIQWQNRVILRVTVFELPATQTKTTQKRIQ